MALTERSRSALYQGLGTIIDDEEAVGEVLSHFPARDVEEPVTKDHLRAEMAELRAEMAQLRAEVRAELRDLDQRMATGFAAADQRMASHAAATHRLIEARARDAQRWTIGTMIALMAVVVGALTALS
ncbi:hypothetical protein [Iamia sp.]|uniref:hypothetical protein n=1 Tax=Iamia sp. TaxID=2722710 RepID=UPI002BA12E78|nr:hypothetical protein [Iamia sp.]HXH57361.1 hypothetical protein [Iamia sp.]